MQGQSLISVLMETEGIEQVRVYQRTVDTFHVQIVRSDKYREESEARIRRLWSERFRAPLRVTFEYLPQLPIERSGKFRHIVSDLPMGQDLRKTKTQRILVR